MAPMSAQPRTMRTSTRRSMAYARRLRKADVARDVARRGPMALFRTGKPNVKALAKRGDEDGLVAASGYQDLIAAPDGGMLDRGAAIRTEAILALGRLGPEAGTEAVRAALSDPADAVRVAAIRVLFAHRAAVSLASALAWLSADHGHSRALAIRALLELRVPECAPALAVALVNATGEAPVGDDEAALLQLLVHAATGADTAADAVEELLIALADERDPVADRAEELLVLIAPVSTEGVIAELKAGAAPHRAAAVLAQIKDTRALDRLGMVALVVGVATMIRPIVHEAISDAEVKPALTEADKHARGNGDGGVPAPDTISQGELERLLAGSEGSDESGE